MIQEGIFIKVVELYDNSMVQEAVFIKGTGLWTIYYIFMSSMYYPALTALLSTFVIPFSALFDISCIMIFAPLKITIKLP